MVLVVYGVVDALPLDGVRPFEHQLEVWNPGKATDLFVVVLFVLLGLVDMNPF